VLALRRAGLRAIRLSANDRAVEYLSRSIELVQKLEAGDKRGRMEADLQLQLATALFALKGFTAPEVEQAYARATELMMGSAPAAEQFPIQLGLAIHYGERGQFDRSARLVERMMEQASKGDDAMRLQALHARWMYSLFHGRIDDAVAAAEEARAIYRPDIHHQLSFRYGNHDPGVCALTLGAMARALRGESVQAVEQLQEAIGLSDVLEHAVSRAHPRSHLPFVHQVNGDVHAALLASEQALALEDKVVHPTFFLHAHAVHGWALSREGHYDEGVAELEKTLAEQLRIADYIFGVVGGALLAEIHVRRDRLDTARAVIDELRSATASMGTYFSEPELHRVEAECFRLDGSEPNARRLFIRAIDTAREHGSWALAIRAAVGLLQASSAERETDLQLLGDLCERLPPENDTEYRHEAEALLGRIATTAASTAPQVAGALLYRDRSAPPT
jgi:tetratricopeptide (TPR) repeat protein